MPRLKKKNLGHLQSDITYVVASSLWDSIPLLPVILDIFSAKRDETHKNETVLTF
jgi:hypothetical protein